MDNSSRDAVRSARVRGACQRCRRQKLKRPCTLCKRAGVSCLEQARSQWKEYALLKKKRRSQDGSTATPGRDAIQPSVPVIEVQAISSTPPQNRAPSNAAFTAPDCSPKATETSSGTMRLVENAFQLHGTSTPETLSRPARSQVPSLVVASNAHQGQSDLASSIGSVLPAPHIVELLVHTYFDRVHWFLLLFHQDDFRQRLGHLCSQWRRSPKASVDEDPGFACTVLGVLCISLEYVDEYRRGILRAMGAESHALQQQILHCVKVNLFDILSLQSLEAVQTCVLLGTFYLYHGNPAFAWPICGSALSIAYTLGLHRKHANSSERAASLDGHKSEAQKRCWWAVYEIQTFCSMLYGYPALISERDCDVDFLDPGAYQSLTCSSIASHPDQVSLRSYKTLMSKLSTIIRSALAELYSKQYRSCRSIDAREISLLVDLVDIHNERLLEWRANIPYYLQMDTNRSQQDSYESKAEIERDIGASGPKFESYLIQLQSLALKLAYENTRILLHRPLLSIHTGKSQDLNTSGSTTGRLFHTAQTPIRSAIHACRDAAIETSRLGTTPAFEHIPGTYAAAFAGSHLFTAGVTLCFLASMEPLSSSSYQNKEALRSIMEMQRHLKAQALPVSRGEEILQELAKPVLERECEAMVGKVTRSRPGPGSVSSDVVNESSNDAPAVEPGAACVSNEVHGDKEANDTLFGINGTIPDTQSESMLEWWSDSAMDSLFVDFEQVLSTRYDGAQEQAWIWNLDNFEQW